MIVTHKLLDCNAIIVTHKLLDCNEIIVTHKLSDCNEMIVTHKLSKSTPSQIHLGVVLCSEVIYMDRVQGPSA